MSAFKWFLIGCVIGLLLVASFKLFLFVAFVIAVITFMDWSGDGDGRQRRWDE